jgi:hypothetical protein
MPVPFLSKYKQDTVRRTIKPIIIDKENTIETSLTPSIPSLKVLTTYSIGFAIEIDLHRSGRIFIE